VEGVTEAGDEQLNLLWLG
jgi:hypothetical protein